MDELLKKLLSSEVLTEETKKELEEAFKKQINEAVESAKKDATEKVKTELTEQWVSERDALVEAIDTKVNEFLTQEIKELKDDISSFRDLEAEYAKKLVDEKTTLAETLQKDMGELIEKINSFMEVRLSAEFDELKEDISEVRKVEFGRKVFESFVEQYKTHFVDPDSAEAKLRETEEKLSEAKKVADTSAKKVAGYERQFKMESVLKPLGGKQREVMEMLLKNVATEQLDEGYKTFIGRVVSATNTDEKDGDTTEKETPVLAEDQSASSKEVKGDKKTVAKTGDDETLLAEQAHADEADSKEDAPDSEFVKKMRKLAGLA